MLLTDNFYLTAEPVRLWIEVNPETVSLDCNNVQKTPLSIRFWSGEGSLKTALTAYLTLKVESVVGSAVTNLYTYNSAGAVNSYSYTIPSNSYPTANRISVHAYEDAARTKEIGGKQVNIVVENPTPFPRSEAWSTGLTYKNGEYLLQEDVIYMWSSRVPGNTSVSPKADLSSATPSGKWKAYQNWPLLATNIALIKFGLIGSAVFKDEFMYSQQGKTAAGVATSDYRQFGTDAFTPNILLDFLKGESIFEKTIIKGESEFHGELKGVSGSFRRLNCVDGSGNIVGGISFGSDGRMWLDGDLYHQGTGPDGRSLRFYTADLWCRGMFGARERNTLEIKGTIGYYYSNGISSGAYRMNLTPKTSSNNEVYYEVPCYGTSADYSGMPIDIVAFSNGSQNYNYTLLMADSQRVMVANVNDTSSTHIYTNGKKTEWKGGEMAEVVKLESLLYPSPASAILGRGLMVGAFRDNDWQ